jgi:hypothetical protein
MGSPAQKLIFLLLELPRGRKRSPIGKQRASLFPLRFPFGFQKHPWLLLSPRFLLRYFETREPFRPLRPAKGSACHPLLLISSSNRLTKQSTLPLPNIFPSTLFASVSEYFLLSFRFSFFFFFFFIPAKYDATCLVEIFINVILSYIMASSAASKKPITPKLCSARQC